VRLAPQTHGPSQANSQIEALVASRPDSEIPVAEAPNFSLEILVSLEAQAEGLRRLQVT
jgi:hypothetical protein